MLSRTVLLAVLPDVSVFLVQHTADTIHIHEEWYIFCDFNYNVKLFPFQISYVNEYHEIEHFIVSRNVAINKQETRTHALCFITFIL